MTSDHPTAWRPTPGTAISAGSDRSFSFVATSRNDDHGGDVLRRTQSFINGLALQCERHKLRGELVLVDWNPPASRAPLADVLEWPAGSEWFAANVVTVPRETHLTLPNARSLTMFQMIAKNVGIRRAKGDFVIATNIDILFSDELFHWLKTADFDDRTLYRSDRWDIPNEIQLEPGFDRLLKRARTEAIRKNLRDGTLDLVNGEWTPPELRRVDHMLVHPIKMDLLRLKERLRHGDDPIPVIDHMLDETLPEMRRFYLTPFMHLNACGDFTMLSAAAWADLRGYPEWPVFSWNIDSIILLQAAFNGYGEAISPRDAPHYHIEHSYGSGFTPQGADSLWRRMQQRSITVINWEDFRQLVLEMDDDARKRRRVVFNREDWGMAGRELPERSRRVEAPPARAATRNATILHESFDGLGLACQGVSLFDVEVCPGTKMAVNWASGAVVHLVETPAVPWAYALRLLRPPAAPAEDPYWIRFRARIVHGHFGWGVLSENGRRFVTEMFSLLASDGWREIILHVPAGAGSEVILRNRETGGCRLEMSDVEFFWEAAAKDTMDEAVPAGAEASEWATV